jgi:hypothetical protein
MVEALPDGVILGIEKHQVAKSGEVHKLYTHTRSARIPKKHLILWSSSGSSISIP